MNCPNSALAQILKWANDSNQAGFNFWVHNQFNAHLVARQWCGCISVHPRRVPPHTNIIMHFCMIKHGSTSVVYLHRVSGDGEKHVVTVVIVVVDRLRGS